MTGEPALFEITADELVTRARRPLELAVEKAEQRVEKAEAKADAVRAELADYDAAIAAVREDR